MINSKFKNESRIRKIEIHSTTFHIHPSNTRRIMISNGISALPSTVEESVASQQTHHQQPQSQQQPLASRRAPKRTFALGRLRFQCTRQRVMDVILDWASWCLESFVYLIGPLLILLALSIITLLAYTYFWILLPMMERKHALHPYKTLILALHTGFVLFLLVNVSFNYAACVLQRHTGPHYDKVVRELAATTDFWYPETPAQLASYRRDFSDRMVLRLRRRQARDAEEVAASSSTTTAASNSTVGGVSNPESATGPVPDGMTKRRNPPTVVQPSPRAAATSKQPVVRTWMLMGPYEWGYCSGTHQPKPPRSHYDHVTRSLVLNLDHYCPWMFNASECL
jgi:DHHC palmitoyltransferase